MTVAGGDEVEGADSVGDEVVAVEVAVVETVGTKAVELESHRSPHRLQ